MLTAKYTIENQWEKGEIFSKEQDFQTIDDLENFLAYNRAYIRELSFSGKVEAKND